jgi:hypothetical protein
MNRPQSDPEATAMRITATIAVILACLGAILFAAP